MRNILIVIFLIVGIAVVSCSSGGSGGSSTRAPMGALLVTVDRSSDDSAIQGASISLEGLC